MKIRPATPLDAAQLAAVDQSQPMSAHWSEAGWGNEAAQASSRIWVAEEEGKLIAFLALRYAAGFCEILNIAVVPAWCRRGIGFKLLSGALNYLRAQGIEEVTLEVHVRNVAAISLYSKAGFVETGRREKFYHQTDDALIMGAKL